MRVSDEMRSLFHAWERLTYEMAQLHKTQNLSLNVEAL
jgi:hypothetical protein